MTVKYDATGAQEGSLSTRSATDKELRKLIKEGRKQAAADQQAWERWYFELKKGWM